MVLYRGSWCFVAYYRDEYNVKKQKWQQGFKTKEEAEAAEKLFKAEVSLNMVTFDSTDTLKAFICKWFVKHKETLQPSTINGYNSNIKNHILPALGEIKLKDLKPATIERFYNMLMDKKGLKPKTVKYVHNTLKTALKQAVKEGKLNMNPCTEVKPPKVPKFKPQLLTQEQMQLLAEYIKGNDYELEILLALNLGLRRGEVLGLKFSDVDFVRHTIAIQRQVSTIKDTTNGNSKKSYGIKCLKSESSNRVLSVSPALEELIKQRQQRVNRQKQELKSCYCDDDLMCCNPAGEILSPQTLYHAFKRIIKECGLPTMRFHDLRHSYAVLCIDLNTNIKVLSLTMGHSSVSVTDEVYADSIAAKNNLANKISDIINNV